ncbi:pre-mRna processing factor PRP3 [Cardiosporidium cionae]|uniref:Pre-mRna processing factor PRP3 n=1 Tax=Cardiosporidium cionae TaxID=476202 RepID=A0ABQ7JBV4_9APIC|nr:pre-mRna processing factor PRP3 [Cardiosporidium cionae]|eukprot:KAF8821496.1 pre-mRna processing factor PRP3 [Cardiosporidium cionae]
MGDNTNKSEAEMAVPEDALVSKKLRKTRWGQAEVSANPQIESSFEEAPKSNAAPFSHGTLPFPLPFAAPSTTPQSLAAAAAAASIVTSITFVALSLFNTRMLPVVTGGRGRTTKTCLTFFHCADTPTLPTPGLNFNVMAAATAAREALEKARKAALFQKKMQEQIQTLKASGLAISPQTMLNMSAGNLQSPRPLRLDKFGRELDEEGRVVPILPHFHSTLKINLNRIREETKNKEAAAAPPVAPPVENKWFDPSIITRKTERKRGLQFVEPGTYIKQELQLLRQKEAKHLGIDVKKLRLEKNEIMKRDAARLSILEKSKREMELLKGEEMDISGVNPNLIPVGGAETWSTAVKTWAGLTPSMEWWDEPFLDKIDDPSDEFFPYRINYGILNCYVEHPVIPNAETQQPVAVPMYLTTRERKKLRRRKRQEKEREKQDKIRMGLMSPPPPKMKLANLMRVLGDSAVADPSRVESTVRTQMKERINVHEQRNKERKLTPAQRSQKKEAKWKQEGTERHALLYFVKDLSNKKTLFKIDMNAKQYHLAGCCVMCPDVANVVVVEGGPRSIKSFKKLMLRRIQWGENEDNFKEDEEANETTAGLQSEKQCTLVWEGFIKEKTFTSWKIYPFKTEGEAKQIFKDAKVEHYWDSVINHTSQSPN